MKLLIELSLLKQQNLKQINNILFLAFFVLFLNNFGISQEVVQDSTSKKSFKKAAIVPSSLMGLGLIINNSKFEKNFHVDVRNMVNNSYHVQADDYFEWAPIVELYLADLFGVEAKNHWFDQSKYLFISTFFTTSITELIKKSNGKLRPNGGRHAFPSGHTSFAFNHAAVLQNEFQETAPVLAYSGYAFATATGALRMMNDRHWLSDVLFGAGFGIIVVELVYYFEPFKGFNPFKNSKGITLIPEIGHERLGVNFSYTF